jgi:hypothetical protein
VTAVELLMDSTRPLDNGAKISAMLREEAGRDWADLYRTCDAGPSGQRRHVRIGRVRYLPDGPYEFRIIAADGECAGYATRRPGPQEWTVWRVEYDDVALSLHGYASALSLGVDALLNGDYAAVGRHDSQRRSGGVWQRYIPAPYDLDEARAS